MASEREEKEGRKGECDFYWCPGTRARGDGTGKTMFSLLGS